MKINFLFLQKILLENEYKKSENIRLIEKVKPLKKNKIKNIKKLLSENSEKDKKTKY